jgi:hypothetical protein
VSETPAAMDQMMVTQLIDQSYLSASEQRKRHRPAFSQIAFDRQPRYPPSARPEHVPCRFGCAWIPCSTPEAGGPEVDYRRGRFRQAEIARGPGRAWLHARHGPGKANWSTRIVAHSSGQILIAQPLDSASVGRCAPGKTLHQFFLALSQGIEPADCR